MDNDRKRLAVALLRCNTRLLNTCRDLDRLASMQDQQTKDIISSFTSHIRWSASGLKELAVAE